MENNLVADIFESQLRINACLSMTPAFDATLADNSNQLFLSNTCTTDSATEKNCSPINNINVPHVAFGAKKDPVASAAYLVSVTGAVQKESGGLISKGKFVVYSLAIMRLADGVEHVVNRRFREIKSLYYDLLMDFEDLEFNNAIKFPSDESNWLSSKQSNTATSELVVRRKAGLQNFFYELFKQYPFMFNHPKVQDFLELRSFHGQSVSSFSASITAANSIGNTSLSQNTGVVRSQGATSSSIGALPSLFPEKVDSGWEYDESQGKLVCWDTWKEESPVRPMSYVDFTKFNEWYESKTVAT